MSLQLPETLAVEMQDEVALLRICRPEKRNAIDDVTIRGIGRFFDEPPAAARAVVLHGEGAHFCAGLDLSSLTERSTEDGIGHSRAWHRATDSMEFGGLPVIAVLHGAVVGGGLELAASAHVRVAEKGAFYALPEGSRGIYVGGGASVRVSRLVGVARMMDMMLTGRTHGAEDGVALGFSQYLVEPGEGLARGVALAHRAAENPPMTNFAILQALPRTAAAAPETGLLMESLMAAIAQGSDEAKRRLADFLEKRGAKVVHR